MNERTVHIYHKEDPVLLDRAIQGMQKRLEEKLDWLDLAFGRAWKLTEYRTGGDRFIYPAAYNGSGEYVSMLPNDNFGNFSWFDIYDPQAVKAQVQGLPQLTVSGALVFWYDLRTIWEDARALYTEEIKAQVLEVLTAPGFIIGPGYLSLTAIYERFENIYKGYSVERIYSTNDYDGAQYTDKQYFMYPYAGLRIEFDLTTSELCRKYTI